MWSVLCFWVVTVLQTVSSISVQCKLNKSGTAYTGDLLCNCYEPVTTPWPKESDKPAAKPQNVTVRFETEGGSAHALISWVHAGRFLSDIKDGFYLFLSGEYNLHYYYNCDVNVSKVNATNEEEVNFHFNECCASLEKNGDGWKSEMKLEVYVHARPMHAVDSKAYFAKGEATVPLLQQDDEEIKSPKDKRKKKKQRLKLCRTENRKRRSKKNCRSRGKNKVPVPVSNKVEEPESSSNNTQSLVIIASVCCFMCMLMLGMVLFIVLIKSRNIETRKDQLNEMHRKLLVISENSSGSVPFVNSLVEVMKSTGPPGTKVTTNLRNSTEIASEGITSWIKRNIEVADVVIFVVAVKEQLLLNAMNSTRPENQCSSVSIGLNVAESMSLKNSYRVSREKYLVLNVYGIKNVNSLQFCTYYTLEKDFSKFMKHALHLRRLSNSFDDDCSTLVKLSQSEEVVPSRRGIARANNRDDSNNLNRSISYSGSEMQERPLLEPNIANDFFPSVESNELR